MYKRGDYTDLKSIPENFDMVDYDYSNKDLYVYDMKLGSLAMFTGDKNASESHVVTSPDGNKVLFISDRNGINNIWLRDLETETEKPITNSLDPISSLSLSEDGRRAVFSALNNGGYDIFYIENPFEVELKTADIPNTVFIEKQLTKTKENAENDSLFTLAIDSLKSDSLVLNPETVNNLNSTDSITTVKDTSTLYGNDISLDLNPTNGDSTTVKKGKFKLKERAKFKVTDNVNDDGTFKVNRYKIKFSPDIIYSNVNYSSFYGVQGVAQMAFSDVLGNHRIYVVTSLVLDLKNSDYAFAYYYLPKRIDYGFEAYHSARFLLIGDYTSTALLYRYRTYGVNLNASYPINKFNRIEGALSYNNLTKENLDDPNEPAEKLHYLLPIVSYVHDNTLWGYTAPVRGTRYNLTMFGTPKIGKDGVSFFSAMLDYRTYFKFFDDYSFVWRLNTGASVGKNPQNFYLGGTENWINYDVENNVYPIEDIKDFAFATPIMPLRGYNYNARSGTKFALMNAELRFPLFRYLIFGLLPLGFQNIQGVLFTDIGTVWSDNKKLQFFEKVDDRIKTKDLLVGMGFGTRIFLLYFPVKFDVAWSYDMQKFSKPKFYISLGADF